MPIQHVPGSDVTYHLICFDKDGRELTSDPGGIMSERVREAIRNDPVTDVFITSHGWKGDIPAAKEQYDAWVGAMAACTGDRQRIREKRPDFKALTIGFHWPSQPWGDEEFSGSGGSFAVAADSSGGTNAATVQDAVEDLVDRYAERVADSAEARAALRTIFGAAAQGASPFGMPPEVADAYRTLAREADLASKGVGGAPGDDAEPFDPARALQNAKQVSMVGGLPPGVSFGGFGLSSLLSPLRQISFWKMKQRARTIGESAGFDLLRSLQDAVPENRRDGVRFHLMGHSFGCIVVSSMLNGRDGTGELLKPAATLTLVQGALSLWAYCDAIPNMNDQPGYFNTLFKQGKQKVSGPVITTRSKFDTAVGKFYPLAAGVGMQVAFADQLPKYGGVGAFGIRGGGLNLNEREIADASFDYGFAAGRIYNLECTSVIKEGTGASGAHSDIAKPEVAHAMWDAVIAS